MPRPRSIGVHQVASSSSLSPVLINRLKRKGLSSVVFRQDIELRGDSPPINREEIQTPNVVVALQMHELTDMVLNVLLNVSTSVTGLTLTSESSLEVPHYFLYRTITYRYILLDIVVCYLVPANTALLNFCKPSK